MVPMLMQQKRKLLQKKKNLKLPQLIRLIQLTLWLNQHQPLQKPLQFQQLQLPLINLPKTKPKKSTTDNQKKRKKSGKKRNLVNVNK